MDPFTKRRAAALKSGELSPDSPEGRQLMTDLYREDPQKARDLLSDQDPRLQEDAMRHAGYSNDEIANTVYDDDPWKREELADEHRQPDSGQHHYEHFQPDHGTDLQHDPHREMEQGPQPG